MSNTNIKEGILWCVVIISASGVINICRLRHPQRANSPPHLTQPTSLDLRLKVPSAKSQMDINRIHSYYPYCLLKGSEIFNTKNSTVINELLFKFLILFPHANYNYTGTLII